MDGGGQEGIGRQRQRRTTDVPASPLAHSCWSVLGTLSLMVGSVKFHDFMPHLDPSEW